MRRKRDQRGHTEQTHLKAMWTSRCCRSGFKFISICPASVNTPLTQNLEFSFILHGSSPTKLEAEFNRNSYCAHLPSNVVQVDVTCWQLSQCFQPYTLLKFQNGRLKCYTRLRHHHELSPEQVTHLSTCWYWTVTREHTFQRVVIELSPEYTPFSVLLLNCHQRTHLSTCCYWTVTKEHTFQRVVIELSPEYTPFSVLLLNCHRSTHLSACCYWTVTGVHTFQRVVIELSPEYTPFSVLLLDCHRSTHLSACCYWTVTGVHTFQRVVIELSPEYTLFSVSLLNCHQRTHLSACYWTVNRVHTFQCVIELSPEYTLFSVLLLNCHQGTHLSACYWTVNRVHTFQRVGTKLSSECRGQGSGSEGSRLETWMMSHKSEVAIT